MSKDISSFRTMDDYDLNDKIESIRNKQQKPVSDIKILRAAPRAASQVFVTSHSVEMGASSDGETAVGVGVHADKGVVLRGRVGIAAMPQDISIGGCWIMNPMMLSCLPSTVGTPIPTLLFAPPLGSIRTLVTSVTAMSVAVGAVIAKAAV
jgi:hypothetical protein